MILFRVIVLSFSLSLFSLHSQEVLLGAKDQLEAISNKYASSVKDFKARITWIQDDKTQTGVIQFKNPQKMRIDFDDPKGQVIVTNGYEFWVYIEHMNLLLQQDLLAKEKNKADDGKLTVKTPEVLINPVGFDRFLKEYAIEFESSKSLVEYTDGSMVYKFKLIRWKTSQHGFNVIYLTVEPDGKTRRVEGITAAYKRVVLEFNGYEFNTGLSDLVFEYDTPAHANTVKNFISKQGDSDK